MNAGKAIGNEKYMIAIVPIRKIGETAVPLLSMDVRNLYEAILKKKY